MKALRIVGTNGTHEDIFDCVLDSITYIWFHISDFDSDKRALQEWFSLIVRSRAINLVKKNGMISKEKKTIEGLIQSEMDIEEIAVSNIQYENIVNKIQLMKRPYNEILYRKFILKETLKEIAKTMNLSISKVNYFLYEGKKKIQELIIDG